VLIAGANGISQRLSCLDLFFAAFLASKARYQLTAMNRKGVFLYRAPFVMTITAQRLI
jgi:hypothetical protein